MSENERKDTIDSTNVNFAANIANAEAIKIHGSAIREHFVAYSGEDRAAGIKLTKGLKSISRSAINKKYKVSNVKQQAGFAAEVKTAARENADKILDGHTTRATRTDDMVKQSNGRGSTIGGVNEQIYDIAEVDKNGIYVQGSGRQLKFIGGDAKSCADKLIGKKFDKYRDAEAKLEVPSDFYEEVYKELENKADKLKKQISSEKCKNILSKEEQLKRIEKTKSLLKEGKLSNKEAIEARLHPKLSTAKDIAKISNNAGMQTAKNAAILGGGISAIQNITSAIKGEKLPEDALLDTISDTTKAAASGYIVGYGSAALKGALENAPKECLRSLADSNIPAVIVTSVLEVGKTLARYCNGEIDGTDCFIELGEKGAGIIASTAGAAIGQALIPIPVLGGVVGSMVGYALSSAYYNSLVTLLKEAKASQVERERIEAECYESILAMKEFQIQLTLAVNNYMTEYITVFQNALTLMNENYKTPDVDKFIYGANLITKQLGGTPHFETFEQCDELMSSDAVIKI